MSTRYQHGLYDPRLNPSEGLDSCARILAFLQEAMTWPPDSPVALTGDAIDGLASILGLVETAVRDISEVVGVIDMPSFLKAREAVKRMDAAIKRHAKGTTAES
ncbi:MAG: hypothetical protein WB930_13810 [Syntrophobacteraceae bacterium]